jgi:hypothetical protein
MRYLFIAVFLAGCDSVDQSLSGPESDVTTHQTMTFRVESPDPQPHLSQRGQAEIISEVGVIQFRPRVRSLPWDTTMTYFQGPKGFAVSGVQGDITISMFVGDSLVTQNQAKIGSRNGGIVGLTYDTPFLEFSGWMVGGNSVREFQDGLGGQALRRQDPQSYRDYSIAGRVYSYGTFRWEVDTLGVTRSLIQVWVERPFSLFLYSNESTSPVETSHELNFGGL